MYEFIKGKLIEITPLHAVVDVGGIGYKLSVPLSLMGKIEGDGREIFFYTSWIVREMAHTLYGFLEKEERELFELLITISGIGPKTALNLIGHLSANELQKAIGSQNILALSKVPGIGKKTAERLIVELKDKLKFSFDEPLAPSQKIHDAISALIHLGLNPTHAKQAINQALKEISSESDLSTLIATALKKKA